MILYHALIAILGTFYKMLHVTLVQQDSQIQFHAILLKLLHVLVGSLLIMGNVVFATQDLLNA